MELDDLKKSWNILDKQLQKEKIVDEKQIEALIATYQSGTTKGLNRLTGLQKASLGIGLIFAILLLLTIVVDTKCFSIKSLSVKETVMGVFVVLSLFGAFWWDWRTYTFTRKIKIDEASTAQIIERVNKFREKIKYEVIIVCSWILLFIGLYYWIQDFYELPLTSQIIFISGSLSLVGGILFVIYKKLIYKRLNDIEKNLNELKELETYHIA